MSHESRGSKTHVWLTPPWVIDALGGPDSFDLDPCAAPDPRPWPTARRMNGKADANGLLIKWAGRVWLNPPYETEEIVKWMRRLADHGRGTALIFARPDTEMFQEQVLRRADGILFFFGRLNFHRPDGGRSKGRSGAPPCLVAYGPDDLARLEQSGIPGTLVRLGPGHSINTGTPARSRRRSSDRIPGL